MTRTFNNFDPTEAPLADLSMVGDGDEIELLHAVEEVFDISILDADAEKILTVGDLYRSILAQLESGDENRGKCRTAMMFYRLRPILRSMNPNVVLSPMTDLCNFSLGRSCIFAKMMSASGLNQGNVVRFPAARLALTVIGVGIMLLIVGISKAETGAVLGGLIATGLGVMISILARRHWDQGLRTVGDLARALVPHN